MGEAVYFTGNYDRVLANLACEVFEKRGIKIEDKELEMMRDASELFDFIGYGFRTVPERFK